MSKEQAADCAVRSDVGLALTPCAGLASLLTSKHRGLGIDVQRRFNVRTFKPTRELWLIRSGAHAKNGLVLNYCPCCGTCLAALLAGLPEPTDSATPTTRHAA